MIPQDSFKGLGNKIYKVGDDEAKNVSDFDWNSLNNTEKLVKALILKAQWAAKLNAFLD